jgi:hypothetical protein
MPQNATLILTSNAVVSLVSLSPERLADNAISPAKNAVAAAALLVPSVHCAGWTRAQPALNSVIPPGPAANRRRRIKPPSRCNR